jgi:signal transduction histidine kinase
LFRAGQEALVAAEHHSGVGAVDFKMTTDEDTLAMTVVADGDAGTPAPDSRSAIALGFLFHRVEALGGSLTVSHPETGGLVSTTRLALAGLRTR